VEGQVVCSFCAPFGGLRRDVGLNPVTRRVNRHGVGRGHRQAAGCQFDLNRNGSPGRDLDIDHRGRCEAGGVRPAEDTLRSLSISRPTQDSPRQSGCTLTVIYLDLSVYDHKIDPHRILMRLFERCAINNGLRIEDCNVGKVAFA